MVKVNDAVMIPKQNGDKMIRRVQAVTSDGRAVVCTLPDPSASIQECSAKVESSGGEWEVVGVFRAGWLWWHFWPHNGGKHE